ncbi:MAG: F0F1 ATP synthase subunit delta [Gammaproteobacteria bacterium]|nr:F0F1 ATP synthase subunit delta [Gammaproteobacteria bacterium]
MAELATIARPYAKAVFDLAKSDNTLPQWSRMLAFLAVASADPKVRTLLDSPDLSAEEKSSRLADVCGDELNDRARNLVGLLAHNKRLDAIEQIREQFEEHRAEEERVLDVEVITAYELSAEQSEKLRAALQRKFDREVSVTGRVDRDVIGGAVIRAGDTVIDASLRGRLDKLTEALQRN